MTGQPCQTGQTNRSSQADVPDGRASQTQLLSGRLARRASQPDTAPVRQACQTAPVLQACQTGQPDSPSPAGVPARPARPARPDRPARPARQSRHPQCQASLMSCHVMSSSFSKAHTKLIKIVHNVNNNNTTWHQARPNGYNSTKQK